MAPPCFSKKPPSGSAGDPAEPCGGASSTLSPIPPMLSSAPHPLLPPDGWNASSLSERNSPPCRPDVNSYGGKEARYPGPDLPEDIWCRIHFLLPMQDAARAACVSRSFLHSWRCHPNLTFTNETMCPKEDLKAAGSNAIIRDYNNKIDCVLRNRLCADAVTKLKLDYHVPPDGAESYHRLDSWLQMAVTPRTKELELLVWSKEASFDFPCTLLSDRCGGSIQKLLLFRCALRPTFQLGLRSLKTLHLRDVRVTGEELGCLLSSSTALEHLKLVYCDDIVRLEIPCLLQRLSFLEVSGCTNLQVIENKAPNLSRFYLEAGELVQVSFGESKVKDVQLRQGYAINYAIENLPSRVPNLETLNIQSSHEDYDFLSLVHFFDASPSLETFRLYVIEHSMDDWFEGDPSSLRRMPQHCHGSLKSVKIIGFFPQKSMVELTCHLLENAMSLESLTVDASPANYRCSGSKPGRKCSPLTTTAIVKAHKSVLAVKKYIEGNVPSTVKLNVPEPCGRCHRLNESGVV
ncbi:FBD-associated F-box protein At3g52670-like isoform X2 [Triticum dicoccoides]|uniref:FBD-associated F-box protein At3g52670-like isoform X2 n=1 Tax=Triticum dicoccoides TaxID=85692 RepID=UPI001890B922|nr:FBD-associated F-box protein At3g52670-like isoform X2 [Triticum dicoccoides]